MGDQENARQVVGWAFCIVPIVFYGYLVYLWHHYISRIPRGGVVEGRITSTSLSKWRVRKSGNRAFISQVTYEYDVEGKRYTSNVIGLVQVFTVRFIARWMLRKFHVGDQVTVYYDRNDPGNGVLHPESWKWLILVLFLFISIFPVIGLMV